MDRATGLPPSPSLMCNEGLASDSDDSESGVFAGFNTQKTSQKCVFPKSSEVSTEIATEKRRKVSVGQPESFVGLYNWQPEMLEKSRLESSIQKSVNKPVLEDSVPGEKAVKTHPQKFGRKNRLDELKQKFGEDECKRLRDEIFKEYIKKNPFDIELIVERLNYYKMVYPYLKLYEDRFNDLAKVFENGAVNKKVKEVFGKEISDEEIKLLKKIKRLMKNNYHAVKNHEVKKELKNTLSEKLKNNTQPSTSILLEEKTLNDTRPSTSILPEEETLNDTKMPEDLYEIDIDEIDIDEINLGYSDNPNTPSSPPNSLEDLIGSAEFFWDDSFLNRT